LSRDTGCGAIALCALALLTLGWAPASRAATYEPAPAFCEEAALRDWAAPFDRMPKLPTPGWEGRVGLGFRNIALIRYVQEPRLPGGGDVGYVLQQLRNTPPAHPRWDIAVTISRLDRSGRPVERVDLRTWRVRRVASARPLELPVPERRGLYRVTAALTNLAGRKLRSFGYYFRVAKPIRRARLALTATSYRPGETVFARVENYGTETVRYGVPYAIERLEGDVWASAPESPRGRWILPLLGSRPGWSGECNGFGIPASTPPGRYRIVKEVEYEAPDRVPRYSEPTFLTAEFDVVP
jgi:hypothetical protein